MPLHASTLASARRVARTLAVIFFATLVASGVATAQQRPRSQSDSSHEESRGTSRPTVSPGGPSSSRQRVSPGGPSSSRRQPGAAPDTDERSPAVQNRAPEVTAPSPNPLPGQATGGK